MRSHPRNCRQRLDLAFLEACDQQQKVALLENQRAAVPLGATPSNCQLVGLSTSSSQAVNVKQCKHLLAFIVIIIAQISLECRTSNSFENTEQG